MLSIIPSTAHGRGGVNIKIVCLLGNGGAGVI